MVKVNLNGREFYFDNFLLSNLKLVKLGVTKHDDDCVGVVYGRERGGKSVLAQLIAGYLDPTLTIDRIVFSAEEFRDAVIKAKPEQSIIFDEAHGGLSSRNAMGKINRMLVSLLAEIGQKRLFIIIVLPSLWELDRYVGVWRSRFAIEIYTKGFTRGFFKFYNYDKKKGLYMKGKRFYENWVKPNFAGRFCNKYFVDEKEYRAKKLRCLKESFSSKTKQDPMREQRDALIKYLVNKGIKHKEISEVVGLKRVTITRICGGHYCESE